MVNFLKDNYIASQSCKAKKKYIYTGPAFCYLNFFQWGATLCILNENYWFLASDLFQLWTRNDWRFAIRSYLLSPSSLLYDQSKSLLLPFNIGVIVLLLSFKNAYGQPYKDSQFRGI